MAEPCGMPRSCPMQAAPIKPPGGAEPAFIPAAALQLLAAMKLAAICLVRNEADVIAETLTHAAQFCDRIYVIDNGSTDDTWAIAQRLAGEDPRIVALEQNATPYSDGLRAIAYNRFHAERGADDWWLVLDGDEFLAEDPAPVIEQAEREGAGLVWAWQIQFYFTEKDVSAWERGEDRRSRSIRERRRHYSINWQEPRLFRNDPRRPWDPAVNAKVPDGLGRACSRRILNRHYQFRDPEQIAERVRLRYGHRSFAHHVTSPDWQAYVRPSRRLQFHVEGEPWRFTAAGRFHHWRRSLPRRLRRWLGM